MSHVETDHGETAADGDPGATARATPTDTRRGGTPAARAGAWVDARPVWLRWTAVLLALGTLSAVLVGAFLPQKEALSRADEYVYIDAVDKATRGEITRQGAQVDEYAMELLSCRGIDILGPMGETCGGPYDPSTFPYRGGITSADIHSPVYYFVTAWGARALQALTPLEGLLSAARATGAVWLALGLTAMVLLARDLGAGRVASGAAALVVLAAPAVRWTNIYITPDALNLLAGSLIVLAAWRYATGRWRPWVLVVLSAVFAAVKAQNMLATALAALFLLLIALTVDRSWSRVLRHLAVGVVAVLAAVGVQVVYSVLRAAWALAPAPDMDTSSPLRWRTVVRQTQAFLFPVTAGPDASYRPALEIVSPSPWAGLIGWAIAGAVLAGAIFVRHLTPERVTFARATALSVVLAGPLFYLAMFVVTGRAFWLPDRYGMVMLPAMAGILAFLSDRRWIQVVLLALAVAGYVEALTTFRMA